MVEEATEVAEEVEDIGEGEDISPIAVAWEEVNTMTLIKGKESINHGMIAKAIEIETKAIIPKNIKITKRRIEVDGGMVSKKPKNVRWRDLGGSVITTSSTNVTWASRSDRSIYHICNKNI